MNFCAISFNRSRDITIPKILENLRLQPPYQATPSKIISILSLKISILLAKFCTIPCNTIRDTTTTAILEKTE